METLKPPSRTGPGPENKAETSGATRATLPVEPEQTGSTPNTPEGGPAPSTMTWLLDSLYDLAGSLFGRKFRPGESIDLQPFFSEDEFRRMDDLAHGLDLLKEVRRYKVIAHLLSTGGYFEFPLPSGIWETIRLEGLFRGEARQVLPKIFAGVTQLTQDLLQTDGSKGHGKAAQWSGLLDKVAEAWSFENRLESMGEMIYGTGIIEETVSDLEVAMTGWTEPSGHAVGFVYALEAGKPYVYACNTGGLSDSCRTVIKYSIKNEHLFSTFLNKGDMEPSRVRTFWASGPQSFGLERCPEEEQIPLTIERTHQRRGNCPIAARKSCQLAMIWSQGSQAGLSPEEIKTVYKITSTLIRGVGVQAALKQKNRDFLENTLVAMISKWDRPDCRRDAYRVADAILDYHDEAKSGLDPSRAPLEELKSEDSLAFLRRALQVSEIDLNKVDKHGWSLLDYARRAHNREVVALLHRLGA